MMTLLQNCVWVFSMTLALGVAGGVATRPFSWSLPFAPLIQPLIGLLLISTGTLALYVVLHLPLRIAGGVAWGVCCFASMMTRNQEARRRRSLGDWCALVGVSLFAGLLAAAVTTATSIRYGEPAFVYLDGTDHLGYAHMADWLNEHLVTELPVLDRTQPYTSWPHLLVTHDPRFGTFTTLALVSQVVGRSGMFSYDIACALVLTITVLAMAGVFARTRVSLALLVLGLVTCHWFDYGRTGFFAKAIAFPSIFVVAGLFMVAARQRLTLYPVTVLVLLTSGAALMQSGAAAALFLAVIGGPYVCLCAAYGMSARELGDLLRVRHDDSPLSSSKQCARVIVREGAIGLGLLSCTPVISSGTLARPLSPSFPDWGHSWEVIFPRVLELETQNLAASVMRPWQLNSALFISVCLVLGIAVLAVFRRDARATAMIVGPAVLLMMLRVADRRAVAFQMIGSFYPLFLCAAQRRNASSARLSRQRCPQRLPDYRG